MQEAFDAETIFSKYFVMTSCELPQSVTGRLFELAKLSANFFLNT